MSYKERVITTVSAMSETQSEKIWRYLQKKRRRNRRKTVKTENKPQQPPKQGKELTLEILKSLDTEGIDVDKPLTYEEIMESHRRLENGEGYRVSNLDDLWRMLDEC
jgi:hypothetical protein